MEGGFSSDGIIDSGGGKIKRRLSLGRAGGRRGLPRSFHLSHFSFLNGGFAPSSVVQVGHYAVNLGRMTSFGWRYPTSLYRMKNRLFCRASASYGDGGVHAGWLKLRQGATVSAAAAAASFCRLQISCGGREREGTIREGAARRRRRVTDFGIRQIPFKSRHFLSKTRSRKREGEKERV